MVCSIYWINIVQMMTALRAIHGSKIYIHRECILNIDWNALSVFGGCEAYYEHFIDEFKIYITMYFQPS